jgi:hypothetical protein
MKRLIVALVVTGAIALIPTVADAYTDQGTAHVQLSEHAKGLLSELNGPHGHVAFVYGYGVDPNAMWLDHGFWGGRVWVDYSPWWDYRTRTFRAMTFWNCLAMSPSWVYCERKDS